MAQPKLREKLSRLASVQRLREKKFTKFIEEFIDVLDESQVLMTASSLAYTTLLSIIPLLVVSFAVFQAFGGMDKLLEIIQPMIVENLTQGASEEAIQTVHKLIGNVHTGAVGAGGLIGLLVTSMGLLTSCEKAINKIWKAPMSRTFFTRIASYWFFITLGPVTFSVFIGFFSTGASGSFDKILPSGTGTFALSGILFSLVYKFVPSVKVRWAPAIIAALYTACLWTLARAGYAFYAKHVVSYNKLYGSLGAIPIILVWIYINWIVVLSGAALSALIQRRVLK